MRKITFLKIFLLLFPMLVFSQTTWNFDNTAETWTQTGSTLTLNPTSVTLTTNGVVNPTFGIAAANVNATTNKYAVITIKVGAGGPTYLRVSYPDVVTGTGRIFKPVVITNGDTAFKTYYVDLTNASWTGTVNDIKLHFKNNDGTAGGANHTSTGVPIEIDKIQIVQFPEKNIYEFNTNGDAESWSVLDGTINVNAGAITLTPNPGFASKIKQDVFAVNASSNGYLHIFYKNTSALNNQIRFQFKSSLDAFVALKGTNAAVNQNMSAFEELIVNLSSIPEWTGTAKEFQIIIRDTNNGNLASAGDFVIDRIVFDNNPPLATQNFTAENAISVFPNPTKDILSIDSASAIKNIEIFNVNGQKVADYSKAISTQINVSELQTGIYFIKLLTEDLSVKTMKFIKL